jgi:hypothetical protein
MSSKSLTVRVMTLTIVVGILLGGTAPVFAQDGGGIGDVIGSLVEAITEVIKNVAVAVGVLGLSVWGIGKVARPLFPQIAGLTQNYIPDLLIGVAVVLVASEIVNGLASAMGGG